MTQSKKNAGYTIVEVILFLAISGMMFIIASIMISGKQSKAEFRQGMNNINSRVNTVINDVSNGFYPGGDFNCTAPGPGLAGGLSFSPSAVEQGTNKNCVFMGKVLQFMSTGTDNRGYNVYSVAGRQYTSTVPSSVPPIDLTDARLTPITNPDLTDRQTLQWGLRAIRMVNNGADISGIGFLSTLANVNSGSGTLESGAQGLNIVPITSGGGGDLSLPIQSLTNTSIANNINVIVCFEGGDHQYGTLTIGGDTGSERLASKIKIYTAADQIPAVCGAAL